jgi:hypothetical protein
MKHLLEITVCLLLSTSCSINAKYRITEIEYCVKEPGGRMVICEDGEYVEEEDYDEDSVYDTYR